MQNYIGKYKITVVIFVILFCIGTGWIGYVIFGHEFIKTIYEGRPSEFLNNIIKNGELRSLEFYFREADWLFFNLSIFFAIGVFLLYLIILGKNKSIFYGIVAGYILYCIFFIFKTSFAIDSKRYFVLFDDAMVSMRYAKNLVKGYGLVWNPGGARVEGYTNFLWVIYMAFWHLFPINIAKISLPIQISGALFLTISLFLVKKIADDISNGNRYVSIGAVLLTATYIPINFWGLKGMETSVLGFIILLALLRILRCLKENRFDLFLFIILGVGILLRPDFILLYIGISLFIIAAIKEKRIENVFVALGIFFLVVGTQTLFRLFYYKDIFPNTYYLKITGVPFILRIQKGLWVAKEFIKNMSWFLFTLPFIYYILKRKDKKVQLLSLVFLVQFFYSVYAGGDAWEWWGHLANRYLCIAIPAFFILISLMINYLMEKIKIFISKPSTIGIAIKKCCFSILILFVMLQLHGGFVKTLVNFLGIAIDRDKNMVKLALKLKDITTPDAKIAVVWAGTIPYFSDRYYIDILGKNDAFIARQKAKIKSYKDFDPGHNKYDYNYSIGKLKPDIVVQLWSAMDETLEYLNKDYKIVAIRGAQIACTYNNKIFCKKNSPSIEWANIEKEILIK